MSGSWIIQPVIAVISNSREFKGPFLLTCQSFVNLYFIAPYPKILQVCLIVYLFFKLVELLLCMGFLPGTHSCNMSWFQQRRLPCLTYIYFRFIFCFICNNGRSQISITLLHILLMVYFIPIFLLALFYVLDSQFTFTYVISFF